ncbi:sulfite exporter TauE/SafE family protein [Endozoicomonadaceae bacterium StTr2]
MIFLAYLLLGAVAGTMAGLFGIGGGLVVVPALVYSFTLQGISESVLTHLAVGTSLGTIVLTSISSIRGHHKRGAVMWQVFIWLTAGIAVGAALGAMTASLLSGPSLQKLIGGFAFLMAVKMWFGVDPAAGEAALAPRKPILVSAGAVIGWASGIFGIGGGTLTVPFLNKCRYTMQQAVGTSAACGLPIALSAVLTNIVVGWGHADLPPWTTGFLFWPGLLGIAITSTIFARFGVKLAHQMSPEKLRRAFAVFLLVVSIDFLLI